jgi:hypothetical protein
VSTTIGTVQSCDIERRRGDTRAIQITLKSNGTAVSVVGFSALLTISTEKDPPDATTLVYQATGTPANSPATDGVIAFDFSDFASQSPQLVPGNYFYDIQITDAGGLLSTPVKGKFKIEQDITK